jgi:hypothetical protein
MSGIYGIGQAFKSIFGLKEGGAVPVSLPEKRSPFMEALHRLNNMPKAPPRHSLVPIRRKCGGVVKKTKAKKGKKKGKDKK